MRRTTRAAGWALTLAAVLGIGFAAGRAQESDEEAGRSILAVFGVGGVLTDDGILYQYMPEAGAWMTIDQAFAREGRETHILPLPVPPEEVAAMESWGFLVTVEDDVWQYDLAKNVWQRIGAP